MGPGLGRIGTWLGTRFGGFTLHFHKFDIDLFLREMRKKEAEIYKGSTPDEYDRLDGEPYQAWIEDEVTIQAVLNSANGVWAGWKRSELPDPTNPTMDRLMEENAKLKAATNKADGD